MRRPWWAYVWVLPVTLMGLSLLLLARLTGSKVCQIEGVLECTGGVVNAFTKLPFFNQFAAITFGHVIFAQNEACMARLRVHERTHVMQYERWGILFPVLYLLSSAWALVRGKDYYRDNIFEIEAFAAQHLAEASAG